MPDPLPLGRFDACLAITLKYEGGWSNHPRDPGGATNKGITQKTYDAYRKQHTLPKRSVRAITDDEVGQIYWGEYWLPVRGIQLPVGVDLVCFDAGVMSGPARAAKWLQRSVGTIPDGIVGLLTVHAASGQSAVTTINRVCDKRLAFCRGLATWGTFGTGWARRIKDVREKALAMTTTP